MAELWGIPVPTMEQIIVGAELVVILYVPKKLMSKIDSRFRKERNRIIHRHVKTGHGGRLKRCVDNECSSLRSSGQPAAVPAAMELPPELLEIDLQQ